jgi:hypothetical protein
MNKKLLNTMDQIKKYLWMIYKENVQFFHFDITWLVSPLPFFEEKYSLFYFQLV